jgi:hypothetical protein
METSMMYKTAKARLVAIAGLGLALSGTCALAQNCPAPSNNNIFNLSLCVEGQVSSVGSNSIQDIVDQLDADQLRSRFANYDESVSAGEFRLDLRGLPLTLNYDQNSTVLVFAVPSLGINEIFNGGTRNASNDLFEDYIKQNGDRILRELLRVSAVDPLAGNPASVQSQMVAGDFEAGTDPTYDTLGPGGSLGLGARFGSYSTGDFTQNVFTLPISYSYTFANYDRLIVRAPITYMEVDGAEAYRGMLGLSYRKNIFARWSLTPALGYGITGSSDLGSLGHIFSGSLTSDLLLYDSSRVQISMGNMAGYYLTLPIRLGDYSVDYNLENTITRNGFLFAVPLHREVWGQQLSLDIYITDTRFFGDALYSDNYQEIGISVGPLRSADKLEPNTASHPFGVGIKYLTGEHDVGGFELNFGYRF